MWHRGPPREERRSGELPSSKWPTTVADAAADVIGLVSGKEKDQLRSASREALIGYHFTLGTLIRDRYALWGANEKLLRAAGNALGRPSQFPCHPDDASEAIIEAAWRSLQA